MIKNLEIMMNITLNDLDKKELETIANYLDGKFNDFGKKMI